MEAKNSEINRWLELQKKFDADYEGRLETYNQQVQSLRLEKEKFAKENPDCPYIDQMFLNVLAPPQRCEIKIIR